MTTININSKFYRGLKKRYEEAVSKNEKRFMYEGNEYLTAYAKYLLEYCEMKGIKK